jgi:hypothetical protein
MLGTFRRRSEISNPDFKEFMDKFIAEGSVSFDSGIPLAVLALSPYR